MIFDMLQIVNLMAPYLLEILQGFECLDAGVIWLPGDISVPPGDVFRAHCAF